MPKSNPSFRLNDLLKDLEKHRPAGRAVAAFDADGTLWDMDMGEHFFNYEIQKKLVPLPADPWGHYHGMKDAVSKPAAYVWLAQINNGVALETVRQWTRDAFAEVSSLPYFEEQYRIIQKLRELDVEVYIVTASIKWAVEPAAEQLGIARDHVVGIETEVVDGIVTEKTKGIITYREGKIESLRQHTGGIDPFFAAGNTEGDHFLLEGASALRLVVASAPSGTENFETEREMVALASQRGWYVNDYT